MGWPVWPPSTGLPCSFERDHTLSSACAPEEALNLKAILGTFATKQKKAGVALLLPDQTDRMIISDKEASIVIIKGKCIYGDSNPNIHVSNNTASKYMERRQITNPKFISVDFIVLLSVIAKMTKHKISKNRKT